MVTMVVRWSSRLLKPLLESGEVLLRRAQIAIL